jgi:hypothetical protein
MKDFVTYEQALALKGLDFDEPCFAIMHPDLNFEITFRDSFLKNSEISDHLITLPTISQAFKHFREKYFLSNSVPCYTKKLGDKIPIYYFEIRYEGEQCEINGDKFSKYEEAESKCLDRLIEIAKAQTV